MTNLATTIPATTITLGKGRPVFPALYSRLRNYPALLQLAQQREQFGIAKYGQTLMTDDSRDTATEIVNEMLDMLVYFQKLILQHGSESWSEVLMQSQIEICAEMIEYVACSLMDAA